MGTQRGERSTTDKETNGELQRKTKRNKNKARPTTIGLDAGAETGLGFECIWKHCRAGCHVGRKRKRNISPHPKKRVSKRCDELHFQLSYFRSR